MPLRILVLGPVAAKTLEALGRLEPDAEILPSAAAHELLSRVASDDPHLVLAGAGAFDWAGSSSLLHQVLESEFARAGRYRHPLAVMLVGIDRVEALAETHGDAAIEEWRRALAETLRRSLRRIDMIARTGANEIAVLLPETTAAGARVVATRARSFATHLIVKDTALAAGHALPVKASVSIGVCDAPRDGLTSVDDFLDAARRALARAMTAGSDPIEVAGP